ncbi:hypothetical protein GCM10009110_09260 [Psychrobacter piscatorii]
MRIHIKMTTTVKPNKVNTYKLDKGLINNKKTKSNKTIRHSEIKISIGNKKA